MIRKFLLFFAAFLVSFSSLASGKEIKKTSAEWSAYLFIDTFNRLCVKNIGRTDLFLKELKILKAQELSQADAKPYLRGPEGSLWTIKSVAGEFIVALRSDDVCTLQGKKLGATLVEDGFINLLEKKQPATTIQRLRDQRSQDQVFHMLSYIWVVHGSTQRTVFSLSTSTDPDARLHAIASVAFLE